MKQAAAGIPESEENHALQAALFAVDTFAAITACRLPHKSDVRLQPRIAFMTGNNQHKP